MQYKMINTIIQVIAKRFKTTSPSPLGRWNIDYCTKKINSKIDYSNIDHCGPCGQYKYTKPSSKNITTKQFEHNKSNSAKCK